METTIYYDEFQKQFPIGNVELVEEITKYDLSEKELRIKKSGYNKIKDEIGRVGQFALLELTENLIGRIRRYNCKPLDNSSREYLAQYHGHLDELPSSFPHTIIF